MVALEEEYTALNETSSKDIQMVSKSFVELEIKKGKESYSNLSGFSEKVHENVLSEPKRSR